MRVHGRSGDAVFPLVTMWARSGEEQWLTAAEELFAWSENMVRPDGSYNNDTNSSWNGITVFSAIGLGETLLHYGGRLPQADRTAWTARFETSSRYLLQNIEAIGGNINYPVTKNFRCIQRTPKDSAFWYRDWIAGHNVSAPDNTNL